jgi:hypothetical protein
MATRGPDSAERDETANEPELPFDFFIFPNIPRR